MKLQEDYMQRNTKEISKLKLAYQLYGSYMVYTMFDNNSDEVFVLNKILKQLIRNT